MMMIKGISVLLAVLALAVTTMVGSVTRAWAQDASYACILPNGENVQILANKTLPNVAVARRDSAGRRTIVINPTLMELFQPATRWFWLAHECAHQQLGHTLGNYGPDREQQADCYAAKQMVKNRQMDADDLRAIEEDISQLGGNYKAYLPGPARAFNIDECVVQAVQEIQQSQ
ncbi:hypothetical protein [Magnetovibrio sp.]|uniref:hypothetical protein n=1 Tax=Magnetovibrio sp. TaxID=2024836 RepID=UPI002F941485